MMPLSSPSAIGRTASRDCSAVPAAATPRQTGARLARLAMAAALGIGLAGCAGSEPLVPVAPDPKVPVVAGDSFPNLAGPQAAGRRPTLSQEERSRLERDLDGTARDRQRKLREKIETDG